MRPEDLDKMFEEAFAKVGSRNEEHRQKMEALKLRLKESRAHMRETVRKQEELNASLQAEWQVKRTIVSDSVRFRREREMEMTVLLNEQAAMIDAIASRLRNRAGGN